MDTNGSVSTAASGDVMIKNGMSVLIRRGDQERILEFNSTETVAYGRGSAHQVVELSNALGQPNHSSYRVRVREKLASEPAQGHAGNKCLLEVLSDQDVTLSSGNGTTIVSGKDNRDIFDDNKAQKLTTEDIKELREQGASADKILDSLISNSASFTKKTEYAQEKYVRKKEKQYGDLLTIELPTLSTLSEYYFKRDPSRILGIRSDTLSQLLSYANVHANGKYIVYETGCSGLVVAAVLARLGGTDDSLLLHIHAGSTPQRQAVNLLNFTKQGLSPLRSLDAFYLVNYNVELSNNKDESGEAEEMGEPASKKVKNIETSESDLAKVDDDVTFVGAKAPPTVNRVDNERSRQILEATKFDGLIIAGKEHPLSVLERVYPHLASSVPIVIYSQVAEPLGDCYFYLKDKSLGINIHLVENWNRIIQVDTERTHPQINMNAHSGYLLVATAVCQS